MIPFVALGLVLIQDKPVEIPSKDLPAKAVCAYCTAIGTMMTESKPVAGVRFHGQAYYFHSKKMRDDWLADPLRYLPPVLPRPMDNLHLTDTNGKTWTSEDMKDKTVLIDFWATWCDPCREMQPTIEAFWKAHQPDGVVVLSVDIDQKRQVLDQFLAKTPLPYPTLFDSNHTFNSWHILALPTVMMIKNGTVTRQWNGEIDRDTLEGALISKR